MKKRELKIEDVSVDALIPYARNARTHSDEQVAQIAASMREFGWTNPILVDEEGGIIAGHGRLAAARKLGLDTVPTIRLEGLTKAQRKALVLADNKLAMNAGWDSEMLKLELSELSELGFSLEMTGFSLDEFKALTFDGNFMPGTEDEQGRLDQKAPVRCPECGHEFSP